MHWFDFESLTTHLAGPVGYFGVLGLLIACGLGVPIPEDIILISGGYIAHEAGHKPFPMMAVGLVGILLGDSVIYGLGRRFGLPFAQRSFLRGLMPPERLERVTTLFRSHGEKMIMAARFLPGVRAVTFFIAGTTRVPYPHFVFFDGLAAMVSAPAWVFLGYRFGPKVVEWAHQSQRVLAIAAFVLATTLLIIKLLAVRRKSIEARTAATVSPRPVD